MQSIRKLNVVSPSGAKRAVAPIRRVQTCAGKFSIPSPAFKAQLVEDLLKAKEQSGKSFTQIAEETGLTNVFVAQLFFNQSQLKPDVAEKLKKAVPTLTPELVEAMQAAPSRRFDPQLIQEPAIYRLYEAIMHGGESIKAVINEECGDGIMSAIDFYCSIDKMEGKHGEARIVITMNGKYLPYVSQHVDDDVAQR